MTKYFCDKCGAEIDIDRNMISISFNAFQESLDKLKEKTNGEKPEFQICVKCAYSVYRHIKYRQNGGDSE